MITPGRGRYFPGMIHTHGLELAAAAPARRVAAPPRWPVCILGVPFDAVTMDEALARIAAMVASGRPHYVVTPNVDFLVQARNNPELRRVLGEADLVLCDGQPLVWASRWLGNPLPERVAGSDLAPRLIAQAERLGHRLFLLGATADANEEACRRLRARHPRLRIAGHYAPPFAPLEKMNHAEMIRRVRAAEPDLLIVGFGCPKQELWMARHGEALGVPVCLGLGGTIDFLAGRVRRAPAWMRRSGLEWAYRLRQEPRRLYRRYWTDLRCFGTALLAQWWRLERAAPASRPGALSLRARASGQEVQATGAFDRAALERAAELCRRVGEGDGDCRVDLAAVEHLDSTGAAMLALWQRKLRRAGRRLVVAGASRRVRALLGAAGIAHLEGSETRRTEVPA